MLLPLLPCRWSWTMLAVWATCQLLFVGTAGASVPVGATFGIPKRILSSRIAPATAVWMTPRGGGALPFEDKDKNDVDPVGDSHNPSNAKQQKKTKKTKKKKQSKPKETALVQDATTSKRKRPSNASKNQRESSRSATNTKRRRRRVKGQKPHSNSTTTHRKNTNNNDRHAPKSSKKKRKRPKSTQQQRLKTTKQKRVPKNGSSLGPSKLPQRRKATAFRRPPTVAGRNPPKQQPQPQPRPARPTAGFWQGMVAGVTGKPTTSPRATNTQSTVVRTLHPPRRTSSPQPRPQDQTSSRGLVKEDNHLRRRRRPSNQSNRPVRLYPLNTHDNMPTKRQRQRGRRKKKKPKDRTAVSTQRHPQDAATKTTTRRTPSQKKRHKAIPGSHQNHHASQQTQRQHSATTSLSPTKSPVQTRSKKKKRKKITTKTESVREEPDTRSSAVTTTTINDIDSHHDHQLKAAIANDNINHAATIMESKEQEAFAPANATTLTNASASECEQQQQQQAIPNATASTSIGTATTIDAIDATVNATPVIEPEADGDHKGTHDHDDYEEEQQQQQQQQLQVTAKSSAASSNQTSDHDISVAEQEPTATMDGAQEPASETELSQDEMTQEQQEEEDYDDDEEEDVVEIASAEKVAAPTQMSDGELSANDSAQEKASSETQDDVGDEDAPLPSNGTTTSKEEEAPPPKDARSNLDSDEESGDESSDGDLPTPPTISSAVGHDSTDSNAAVVHESKLASRQLDEIEEDTDEEINEDDEDATDANDDDDDDDDDDDTSIDVQIRVDDIDLKLHVNRQQQSLHTNNATSDHRPSMANRSDTKGLRDDPLMKTGGIETAATAILDAANSPAGDFESTGGDQTETEDSVLSDIDTAIKADEGEDEYEVVKAELADAESALKEAEAELEATKRQHSLPPTQTISTLGDDDDNSSEDTTGNTTSSSTTIPRGGLQEELGDHGLSEVHNISSTADSKARSECKSDATLKGRTKKRKRRRKSAADTENPTLITETEATGSPFKNSVEALTANTDDQPNNGVKKIPEATQSSTAGSGRARSKRAFNLTALDAQNDLESDMTVAVVTWNLAESSPADDDAGFFRQFRGSDLVLISGQECENIKPRRQEGHRSQQFRRLMIKMLGKNYIPIAIHLLGGIQFGLFCHRSFLDEVESVAIADVPCGIGNVFHNKGAIAGFVQIKAHNPTNGTKKARAKSLKMLFVTAHLAAHVKNVDARDADFWRIIQELEAQTNPPFLPPQSDNPSSSDGGSGSLLLDSMDRIFFCGDLNYRVNLPREAMEHSMRQMQDDPEMEESLRLDLFRHDQLKSTISECRAFGGFVEGKIAFMPTFKFDKGSSNADYDTSHKQRVPAWTDRVVFKPTGTRVLQYEAVPEACHSDHRPVFATFRVSRLAREGNKKERRGERRQRSVGVRAD